MLQEDLWKKVEEPKLQTWSEQQLVSVDGTPIYVLGSAKFEISLAGKNFSHKMVVAKSLTTSAILGRDFLQRNGAVIDLEKQQLSFNRGKEAIPLGANNHKVKGSVCATETITIPTSSELEVTARIQEARDGDVWILEEPPKGHTPATVARALVAKSEFVPVHLLNTRTETVTVYKLQQLGVLESAEQLHSQTTVASVRHKTVKFQRRNSKCCGPRSKTVVLICLKNRQINCINSYCCTLMFLLDQVSKFDVPTRYNTKLTLVLPHPSSKLLEVFLLLRDKKFISHS